MASSVSRRIEASLGGLRSGDIESCLINLFPAIDKTAKRRYQKSGVGDRIRKFLADEEGLISGIATGNIFTGVEISGLTFPQAMYKFGRTSIVHEGELDPRLQFSSDGSVRIGETWVLNRGYLLGSILSVVLSPENKEERLQNDVQVTVFGRHRLRINESWGDREGFKLVMERVWGRRGLFD